MDAEDLKQFCHRLPKVELHAHLNTSYSFETLEELMVLDGGKWEHAAEEKHCSSSRIIDEHFLLFSKIQKLVKTEEAVYLLTYRVIKEFAQDNVKYLELRSTPKNIPETGMTYELYVQSMLRAIRDCEKENVDIQVRLLPSIDRRLGLEVARQTVDLAEKLMHESNGIVIGIDLSGDPQVGNAEDFIPILLDAASRGLKLALHLAEIPSFRETQAVLCQCAPKATLRIGHGTYLHRCEQDSEHTAIEKLVRERGIPIETCITSNILSETVDSVDQHHFKYWLDLKHPVILCTDGKGVYDTSLTEEYMKAATTFRLAKNDLREYVLSTIDSIFENQTFKERLKEKFKQLLEE